MNCLPFSNENVNFFPITCTVYIGCVLFPIFLLLSPVLSAQQDAAQNSAAARKSKDNNSESAKDGLAYSCLLKNELLNAGIEDLKVGRVVWWDGWNGFCHVIIFVGNEMLSCFELVSLGCRFIVFVVH